MKRYIAVIFTLQTLLLCLHSPFVAATSTQLQGSFVDKYQRFERYEQYTGDTALTSSLVAWRGERVNHQLVIWSDEKIKKLNYTLSDLVSEHDSISAKAITLRSIRYAKGDPAARNCGEDDPERPWPPNPKTAVYLADVLSPELPSQINKTDPLKYWLSIDVPQSAKPGVYRGSIEILGKRTQPMRLSYTIQVVDEVLPPAKDWDYHLDIWQFPMSVVNRYNDERRNRKFHIKLWSKEHMQLLEPTYRLLASAGQKVITTYIKDGAMGSINDRDPESVIGVESMVTWYLGKDGKTWEYDFSAFDRYVETVMSWGITEQISAFSPVGWNKDEIPFINKANGTRSKIKAPVGSETYNALWHDFLTAFKKHLEKKGWFEKTVLYFDEIKEEQMKSVIALVKYNSPDWKMGVAYSHSTSEEVLDEFYDISGIYEDVNEFPKKPWQIKTVYTSCTQFFPNNYLTSENSPAELRWLSWFALSSGLDGYLRWAFDNWKHSDPFELRDNKWAAGDFSFVYRDSNDLPMKVMSSVRFESLYEGIQDFEKMRVIFNRLTDCNRQDVVDEMGEILKIFTLDSGAKQGVAKQQLLKGQSWIDFTSTQVLAQCRK